MPDEPIVVSGGSLKIKTKRKLTDGGKQGEDFNYDYPTDGEIYEVEVDGQVIKADKNTKVTIRFRVP